MSEGIKAIIFPVRDVEKAKALYTEVLGATPNMDEAYYVNFSVGGVDVGLDPRGHSQGLTGPVGYWEVDDINKRLEALVEAGAEPLQDVRDVGGGKLIASVRDADGNVIGLMQPA